MQDFLRALARAARAAHKVDRDRALEEAIALFGAGLLPDIQAGWLAEHQERFQQLYRIAVDLLSSPDRRPQLLAELREALPPIAWQLSGGEPEPAAAGAVPPDHQATLDPQLLAFCVEAGVGLMSPQAPEWTQRLEARLPEIQAASDRALAQGRPDLAAQLNVPLWRYWRIRRTDAAGYSILHPILQAGPRPTGEAGARLLHAAGTLAAYAGRFEGADALLEATVGEWRELRDFDGLFKSLANQAINQYLHGDRSRGRWNCSARASAWRGPWPATSSWSPCTTTPAWPPCPRTKPTPRGTTSSAGFNCGLEEPHRRPPSPRKAQPKAYWKDSTIPACPSPTAIGAVGFSVGDAGRSAVSTSTQYQ